MRRYFIVADADMPALEDNFGHWHAIHLGSHGKAGKGHNLVTLVDEHVAAPATWKPMPKLIDARTAIKAKIDHTKLADLGLTGDETMLEAAERLAEIHPLMSH
jgi:hypothetical protein